MPGRGPKNVQVRRSNGVDMRDDRQRDDDAERIGDYYRPGDRRFSGRRENRQDELNKNLRPYKRKRGNRTTGNRGPTFNALGFSRLDSANTHDNDARLRYKVFIYKTGGDPRLMAFAVHCSAPEELIRVTIPLGAITAESVSFEDGEINVKFFVPGTKIVFQEWQSDPQHGGKAHVWMDSDASTGALTHEMEKNALCCGTENYNSFLEKHKPLIWVEDCKQQGHVAVRIGRSEWKPLANFMKSYFSNMHQQDPERFAPTVLQGLFAGFSDDDMVRLLKFEPKDMESLPQNTEETSVTETPLTL